MKILRTNLKRLDMLLIKAEAALSFLFQRQAYWVVDLDNIAYGPLISLKEARTLAVAIGFGRLITSELTVTEWRFALTSGNDVKKLIKRRYSVRSGRLRRGSS